MKQKTITLRAALALLMALAAQPALAGQAGLQVQWELQRKPADTQLAQGALPGALHPYQRRP